jgi:hypothetical protein
VRRIPLARTDIHGYSDRMSPTVLLLRCLPRSRYGKSSLLRRGTRWLAYLRVVGGCYIDRCLDGGSWQLAVVTNKAVRNGRADHDHGLTERQVSRTLRKGGCIVCHYLATTTGCTTPSAPPVCVWPRREAR